MQHTAIARSLVPASDELIASMTTGWAIEERSRPSTVDRAKYCRQRRDQLSAAFPEALIVVPSGSRKVYSHDVVYQPFRPNSNFFWLCGHDEPESVLVLQPVAGGHEPILFLAPRYTVEDGPDFFRDRHNGQLWSGPRPSLTEIEAALEVPCAPRSTLALRLGDKDALVTRGFDGEIDLMFSPSELDLELVQTLARLRLVKDDHEIRMLQQAVDFTVEAFGAVVTELARQPETSERWLEGTFWRHARTLGRGVGTPSIVSAGAHGPIVHWKDNSGRIQPGDVVIIDGAVEGPELYTADLTRTFPVSREWSDVQREVYDAVLASELAAIEAIRPGADFLAPERAAHRVLVERLVDWGVMTGPPSDLIDSNQRLYQRYTLHGVAHSLGIDVHDSTNAREEDWRGGRLREGMVITVEPALYFQGNDLTVPMEMRGLGLRIEDDVVVTSDGCRVLSERLPKGTHEVEQWMSSLNVS